MTVNASKVAVTRALSLEGNTLNAEWKEGEEVNVYDAAGIGSAKNDRGNCGNIVIDGNPIITATGGKYAAGIGSCTRSNNGIGPNSCGDITIKGGTVTAVGGHGAAGIGTSFGCGLNYQGTHETSPRYSVGTVTVGGVTGDISESPYTFPE